MKPLFLSTAASAALLTSCAVPGDGGYGSASYGYDTGYDDDGYYPRGGHGHSHRRHKGTPFTSRDDVRKDADHRTSPDYRDPHHGGSKHGHDDAGHRVDSHGHHVDATGNHTSTPHQGSDHPPRESDARSDSSRRESESSRPESSRSGDSDRSSGSNKSDDIGKKGKD